MSLDLFHPAVARWFERALGTPTEPQLRAWPAIHTHRHTLVAAPTGSGKTLAAFLAALDELVVTGLAAATRGEELPETTQVVYVSPLKALSNDIHVNLEAPLAGIAEELDALGLPPVAIRTLVRTGDTPASERARMTKHPPHILVTTPESLYILLTSDGGRGVLRTARTVIVDEIHAVAGDKRGSHLALSLERLDHLVESDGGRLTRVGLSATQRPIEEVARFLVGQGGSGSPPPACEIVDTGHQRVLDLAVEVPRSPLEAVMAAEVWEEIYDRLADLIREHRTTLVFTNTRRQTERVARHLSERLGEEAVTAHHGSLSREQRHDAERRLKSGRLRALVATASLELGIDVGTVELVCQLGSTRSIATLLQRVGRSGHHLGALPKGRLFPLSRDELAEAAALLEAVARGDLDRLEIPTAPLDILAQQIVAEVAGRGEPGWGEDELFSLVRRAYPYRALARRDFDRVVEMLAQGFATRRGRRGAYLHHDQVHGRLRPRRGARLAALTSGGAIPDTGDFQVILEPAGLLLGTVNEDFAVESLPGNVFQLGNASWRILKIERGRVLVEDARGQPPTLPFWFGEAPGRTTELSAALSRLRSTVEERLAAAGDDLARGVDAAAARLAEEPGLPAVAARQLASYLAAGRAALGTLPTRETIVAERFFDEAGDMHLVLHAPFGSRLNRAWGLALRKRFCRTFNFELQAAAGEDAILLSLGPTHSFPLEDVFRFLHSASARDVLVQALLDAPMFGVRWRWNASRALALLRFRGGRRVPPALQRQQAEDLVAVVFPDQLACLENITGDREIPDHPLVEETVRDCLTEVMDIDGLEALLARMEAGEIGLVARDLAEPSPLAHEILNARPYAFLDDAPLEERRTQAVLARRWLDPETAADLGSLDAAALARVREEARPEATSAEELHDALVVHGWLTAEEGEAGGLVSWLDELAADGRAAVLEAASEAPGAPPLWVAAERLPELRAVFRERRLSPAIAPPARLADTAPDPGAALVELLRGRLQALGPVTASDLAAEAGLPAAAVEAALAALEGEGFVLRGAFTPGRGVGDEPEWCERRLLARIHRLTVQRLRREIEPVSRAVYLRFLAAWQRTAPEERGEGPASLASLLDQLQGFEAPAAAWEGEILPTRLADYDPAWLDALCLAGRYVWARVGAPPSGRGTGRRTGPIRTTPVALLRREDLPFWWQLGAGRSRGDEPELSSDAGRVRHQLAERGASFFDDLVRGTGLLATRVEAALGELAAAGEVTSDSFAGLRALLVPEARRQRRRRSGKTGALSGPEGAGRWSLLPSRNGTSGGETLSPEAVEAAGRTLLRRYGVVFRKLLERESLAPPWRELLRLYRRLEARGEIRGGRFVAGFSGEQFALPEAVGSLRSLRRRQEGGALVSVCAADPLNLLGIVAPGDRLPALAGNRLLLRDGVPLAVREAGRVRFLADADPLRPLAPEERWEAETTLLRRPLPAALRPYLGLPA